MQPAPPNVRGRSGAREATWSRPPRRTNQQGQIVRRKVDPSVDGAALPASLRRVRLARSRCRGPPRPRAPRHGGRRWRCHGHHVLVAVAAADGQRARAHDHEQRAAPHVDGRQAGRQRRRCADVCAPAACASQRRRARVDGIECASEDPGCGDSVRRRDRLHQPRVRQLQ